MRTIRAFSHPRETQLSATELTPAETAGSICRSYFDRRSHQVPANWPSPISRFMDRGPGKPQR